MNQALDAPVLVGEVNPYGADPYYALYPLPLGASGHRLQEHVLGISVGDYEALRRLNLCTGRWSLPAARARAAELLAEVAPGDTKLVLLGAKVAAAFGVRAEPFTVLGRCVFLPHPSGLCRVWNEPRAFVRARKAVRAACPAWADRVGLDLGDPP